MIPDHWSQIDPGPLTDDEAHARVVRLERELADVKGWSKLICAEYDHIAAVIEASITKTLGRRVVAPQRKEHTR
ncbi:MAG: hypothetical protein ABIP03_04940 [Aquihabitans sp.]